MLNGERRIEIKLDFNINNAAKHYAGQQIHVIRDWALMDRFELGDDGYWNGTEGLIPLGAYPANEAPDSVTLDMSVESAAKLWPAFLKCRERLIEYKRRDQFDQSEFQAAADWFAYAARVVADAIPALEVA